VSGTFFVTFPVLILGLLFPKLVLTAAFQTEAKEYEMNAFEQILDELIPAERVTASDFNQARNKGYLNKIIAFLTGRSHQLQDLKTITRRVNICNRHSIGTRTVRIDQIKGSAGRCQDFDQDFNPLKTHNRARWLNIAHAWLSEIYLPPVELIKVKDNYFVRDGHHRISVARYLGVDFIDALVTEWVLSD